MAKNVIVTVTVTCDWCKRIWRDDDEEAPVERPWSWNGVEYLVELCNDCIQKVRDHLQPLFEASEVKKRKTGGRRPLSADQRAIRDRRKLPPGSFDKYRDSDGKYPCPYSGCERVFNHPQHLGNHHQKTHGTYLD